MEEKSAPDLAYMGSAPDLACTHSLAPQTVPACTGSAPPANCFR